MSRLRLHWRLTISSVALIVGAILATGTLAAWALVENTRSATHTMLEREAYALQAQATDLLTDDIRTAPATWLNDDRRIMLLDATGAMHVDTWRHNGGAIRPVPHWLETAIAHVTTHSLRIDHNQRLARIHPLHATSNNGPSLVGWLAVVQDSDSLDFNFNQLALLLAIAASGSAVLAIALTWWQARRATRPLTHLATVNLLHPGGNPKLPEVSGDPDIDNVVAAVEGMAVELRSQLGSTTADRNRLEAIFAAMVEGVVAVDTDESIVLLNRIAGRQLGIPPNVEGRRVWEVCRLHQLSQALGHALKNAEEVKEEVRIIDRGHDQILALHCGPIRDDAGDITGAVAVVHDITDMRHLEQVRRDFVANVSHELKTPLTAIRGVTETLLDDDAMPEDMRTRFLNKIFNHSERLTAIVTDLLSLSRLESDSTHSEERTVDLVGLLKTTVQGLQDEARRRDLNLDHHISCGICHVSGDADWLRQAIDNLIVNALTYTPAGGTVYATLSTDNTSAQLKVTDTGIGIDSVNLERVWERFYRVDRARSRAAGGTGLGLAIVKHVMRLHGGEATVTSRPGAGSTFTLTIPITHAPETVST